jgi:hypothetical protein
MTLDALTSLNTGAAAATQWNLDRDGLFNTDVEMPGRADPETGGEEGSGWPRCPGTWPRQVLAVSGQAG